MALRRLVTRGKRGIDVGLMQISYRYHGGRAGTLATLVRPEDNLRLAAVILAECRLLMGETYRTILSCYHQGRITRRGVAYARRVLQKARKLSPKSLVSVRHLSGLSAQVKTAPAAVRTIRPPSGGRQEYARPPGPHGNKRRRN